MSSERSMLSPRCAEPTGGPLAIQRKGRPLVLRVKPNFRRHRERHRGCRRCQGTCRSRRGWRESVQTDRANSVINTFASSRDRMRNEERSHRSRDVLGQSLEERSPCVEGRGPRSWLRQAVSTTSAKHPARTQADAQTERTERIGPSGCWGEVTTCVEGTQHLRLARPQRRSAADCSKSRVHGRGRTAKFVALGSMSFPRRQLASIES